MMRRTLTASLAVVLSLSTLPATAQEPPAPLEPRGSTALRSDLREAGHRNGRLPDRMLVEVDAGTSSHCLLEGDAAITWRLLILAAEHDGVTGFAAGWCYRTVEQQRATRERNCDWIDPAPAGPEPVQTTDEGDPPPPANPEPEPDPAPDPEPEPDPDPDPAPDPEPQPKPAPPPPDPSPIPDPGPAPAPEPEPDPDPVVEPDPIAEPDPEPAPGPMTEPQPDPQPAAEPGTDGDPILVCRVPTATPGRSNHGWGRAIDVVDTTGRRASVLTCRDPQFEWLVENGPTFGWVLPPWARCGRSTAEPWHWEFAGLTGSISQLIIEQRAARGLEIPQ